METLFTREIYVRYADESGKGYISWHIVWNVERFMKARLKECLERRKAKDYKKGDVVICELVDKETYQRERNQNVRST